MKYFYRIIAISILLVNSVKVAQAIPPPDFIFNIVPQIVQAFTFIALFFSAVFGGLAGVFKKFFDKHPFFAQHKKLVWVFLAILVIAISFGGAYAYGKYKQNAEYQKWIDQSAEQGASEDFETSGNELDKLKLGEISGDTTDVNDEAAKFIKNYYRNLATGQIKAAYDVSSKIVDYQTYASWYKDTVDIKVDSLQKIDENKYSLGFVLKERNNSETRYAVLMELNNNNGNYTIKHSDVRVLAEKNSNQNDSAYFDQNSSTPVVITNQEFARVPSNAYVLDAREDEEYEIGNYPGSHHIRFADIKSGDWIKIPNDRPIYVLCWSGIRGKEVAEFLRTKKILSRYVEKGADGWVSFGGKWNGKIKFRDAHTEEQYRVVFTTGQAREYKQNGVVFVDSRNAEKYRRHHIPGSVSIPIIYTPSSRVEEVLRQVPAGSTAITVCDDFVSCFDATVTGLKLERKGHHFLGRYNKPWEF